MEVGDNEADLQSDTARICHSPFGLLVLLCGEHLRTNLGTHSIRRGLIAILVADLVCGG